MRQKPEKGKGHFMRVLLDENPILRMQHDEEEKLTVTGHMYSKILQHDEEVLTM